MPFYKTQSELAQAVEYLTKIEPRFAPVLRDLGTPGMRKSAPTLETLLVIVIEQFLSLQAATAIWNRAKTAIGEITPQNVLRLSVEDYLKLGLSRSKAKSFHACASANLNFHDPEPESMRKALLEIWGVGPWTADIFLLSVMNYSDAWPAGDVALQAAAQHLFNLRKRPDQKKLTKMGEKWRPHRAAAARLLWAHYRHLKSMPQA